MLPTESAPIDTGLENLLIEREAVVAKLAITGAQLAEAALAHSNAIEANIEVVRKLLEVDDRIREAKSNHNFQ